jgi:hypothetical protein
MAEKQESRFSTELYRALEESEFVLLTFAERLTFVLSVQDELKRVARDKAFFIRGHSAWNMTLSARDSLIIDLASWAKALYSPGGLLRRIEGPDLKALALNWDYGPNDAEYVRTMNAEARSKAFLRLFPAAAGRPHPNQHEDRAALIDRVAAELKPIVTDRHEHRAHRFEKTVATAAMLAPVDVVPQLAACQLLLNDLRMLACNSSFTAYGYDVVEANVDRVDVQDVIDLILCGSIRWIVEGPFTTKAPPEARSYWHRRDAYYERLHAAHDAAGKPEAPFNEERD